MYTREELEGRIFAPNKAEWVEAALRDYRSKEEAAVRTVERGVILPLKRISGTDSYEGGVCDEGFSFVAGFREMVRQSYTVEGGGQNTYLKPLSLAARC